MGIQGDNIMDMIEVPLFLVGASPNVTRLYFFFLSNDGCYRGSLRALAQQLGMSYNQTRNAMLFLLDNSIIKSQTNHKAITYYSMYQQFTAPPKSQSNHKAITKEKKKQKENIDIIDNDNSKKEKNNSLIESKKRKIDFLEGTEQAWARWKEYRRQIGKPYKSELGEQAAYTKALNQSGNNAEEFVKVIEQSIENNWQGTFHIKDREGAGYETGVILKNSETKKYEKW